MMLRYDGKTYNSRFREISLTKRSVDLILIFIEMTEPRGPWTKRPHSTPSRRSAKKPGSTCSDCDKESEQVEPGFLAERREGVECGLFVHGPRGSVISMKIKIRSTDRFVNDISRNLEL